jgi:ubiquitin-conjugating enzyme E2 variant
MQVDASKLPCLVQWKREFTMETALIELRRWVEGLVLRECRCLYVCRYMALPQHKKLPQPAEGSTYE